MSVNLVNGDTLNSDFIAICNAIRAKTGDANTIAYTPGDTSAITTAIGSISGGGGDLDGTLDGTVTEITSNVTTLIPYALYGITGLTELNFPNVTDIGDNALRGGLVDADTYFGSALKSLGGYCCNQLYKNNVSDTFDISFADIRVSNGNCFEQSGITKVLGRWYSTKGSMFLNCTKLVEAHYNLKRTSGSLFRGCTSLADIYLENPEGVVTFDNANYDLQNVPLTCKVHVPDFLLTAYQADATWSKYDLVGMTTTETLYESMESTGLGGVITDIDVGSTTGFEIKFINKQPFSTYDSVYGSIFGRQQYDTTNSLKITTTTNLSHSGRVYIGNRTTNANLYQDDRIQIASYDYSNLTYTAPNESTSVIQTPTWNDSYTGRGVALFGHNQGDSQENIIYPAKKSKCIIYYLKLYESGTLAHNLVPCKLTYQGDTTEVYAFKDTITGKYYQFLGETPTVTLPS